jgi:hypothetical protein
MGSITASAIECAFPYPCYDTCRPEQDSPFLLFLLAERSSMDGARLMLQAQLKRQTHGRAPEHVHTSLACGFKRLQ